MTYLAATFTSQDILFLSLALGAIILVIVIAVAIINLVMLIRDIRKVSSTVGDITSKVHSVVITPVSIVSGIVEKVGPIVEGFVARKMEKMTEEEED